MAGWERDVADALASLPAWTTTPLEVVMQAGTRAAVVVVAVALVFARRLRTAVVALVSGFGAWGLAQVLKELVDRPRPPGSSLSSPGFPSTHSAVVAALACAVLLDRSIPRPLAAAALVVAVLTMVARVHVGVHWPTDGLGGAAIGAVMAFAATKVSTWKR